MTEAIFHLRQQLALHILLTAFGLSLIIENDKHKDFQYHIDKAVKFYSSQYIDTLSIIMNEDPLCLAGEILQMTTLQIDQIPGTVRENYWKGYDTISTEEFYNHNRDLMRHFEMLAENITTSGESFDLEIENVTEIINVDIGQKMGHI